MKLPSITKYFRKKMNRTSYPIDMTFKMLPTLEVFRKAFNGMT
jgi:hypothetical protein